MERSVRTAGYSIGRILALVLLAGHMSQAQNDLALGAHWGGLMYPESEPKVQIGISSLVFTEFDPKHRRYGQVDRPYTPADTALGSYLYRETAGFNNFSVSRTGAIRSQGEVLTNVQYRLGGSLGYSSDIPTKFLQNTVIHSGWNPQPEIDREKVHCENFHAYCFDFAASGELNYMFQNLDLGSSLRFRPTPFFVGGGASISSIASESFAQAGLADVPLVPWRDYGILKGATMARVGVFYFDGWHSDVFPKRAFGYLISQASLELVLFPQTWPVSFRNTLTSHSGLYYNTRREIMPEYFWSLSISTGSFHFEQMNDVPNGGKDYGPSFGARIFADFDRMPEILRRKRKDGKK